MPLRDFTFEITKDKELAYEKVKVLSGARLKKRHHSFKVIAITGAGDVITKNNFLEYDWKSFLNIKGL